MRWQSGVAFGGGAFVYGGYSGKGDEKPGIYEYNVFLNHWYYHNGPDLAIVSQALGYAYSSSIFYIGGWSGDTLRQDVWSYTPSLGTWEKKTDFPVKQYGGVAVTIENIAYAGMGSNASHISNQNLWTTSDGAATWDLKTSYPVSGIVLGGVACNKRLYIIDQSYFITEYNPETDEWTRKSQLPSSRRSVQCIYAVGNKIYIGLGQNRMTMYDPLWDN